MKKIVFTGGGTGGHIYPGLAIVNELRDLLMSDKELSKEQFQFIWFGSNNGSDKNIVDKSNSIDKFVGIPSGKLRRYFSLQNFIDVFKIAIGFMVAFCKLLYYKPVVIFSKGGFVSVPPCYAAKLLGIPVYTHECDFSTGLATRLNMKIAKRLFVSYEETKKNLPLAIQQKTIVTGNPVRTVFYNPNKQNGFNYIFGQNLNLQKPILLIVGGSLGAKQINLLIWENIEWLTENFYVVHQTGKKQDYFNEIIHKDYFPFEFIYQEMPDVMACADIVISRAGANFLWESLSENKPLVLIPLAGEGTRGDQVENAEYFAKKNCAITLDSKNLSSNLLIEALKSLLDDKKRLIMSENQKKVCGDNKPALNIAKIIFTDIRS